MKGLKVIRAEPSNAIDIFPLLKKAAEENVFNPKPNDRQLRAYYFGGLLNELKTDSHFWFLARRGRGYLGVAHALVVPGRWDGSIDALYVDFVYVVNKRRKSGVGTKLINELKSLAEALNVRRIEFVADDPEKWKAEKVNVGMRYNL